MISTETRYKTHNGELLAIIKAFKNWRHYFKDYKHKVFVLTDYNNLCQFINIQSLSFRRVWWAQKLSWYYFQIDYYQEKTNGAADALSCFFQKKQSKKKEFCTENTQIFHSLQISQTNASILDFSFFNPGLTPHYQVLICSTHVLPQLCQFCITLRGELADKKSYQANIGGIRLRLEELQVADKQAMKIREEKLGRQDWENINGMLYHQRLPYLLKIIRTEFISWHYNNPLASYFIVEKIRELVTQKYYLETFCHDVKDYMKKCNICLASKAVQYKLYNNFQFLPMPTH